MAGDSAIAAWLDSCHESAVENVAYTRTRFPDHEDEALAEEAFYAAALAFARNGTPAPASRRRPADIVINTVITAAEDSISDAQETLDGGRLPASREAELIAYRDSWRRFKEFAATY